MARSRPLSPFQFPLRWLFVATLIVAIFAWLTTVVEEDIWFVLLLPTLPLVAMTTSILGIIYLRAGWRAFWVGYGVCLVQVMLLGFFFEWFEFGGPFGDFEMLVAVPLFVIALPALMGWIGYRFYQNGQLPAAVPSTQAAATTANEIDQAA